ncbi:MAG: serine/threonine protein kinase [Gammaproteobacteria bacterium]|nr:serine/threonine protein kinase [Gammaproteobacteria bacterium]
MKALDKHKKLSLDGQYQLKPGKSLGRYYKIVEYLGSGWEGEVYKIEECNTGILRAAKLFYQHHYNNKRIPHIEYAKKLHKLKDCSIIIQYHHQDTIKINDQSIDFLVSDFVDGEILSQYVARQSQKRLCPFEALHLFYTLVLGIEQIHFLGEYHGDIHSDNIFVKRRGLHFEIHLIDLLHLGKANKRHIQEDVFDLIAVFYEMIGGQEYYRSMPKYIKQIILGRKRGLITKQFNVAGQLRLFLENINLG